MKLIRSWGERTKCANSYYQKRVQTCQVSCVRLAWVWCIVHSLTRFCPYVIFMYDILWGARKRLDYRTFGARFTLLHVHFLPLAGLRAVEALTPGRGIYAAVFELSSYRINDMEPRMEGWSTGISYQDPLKFQAGTRILTRFGRRFWPPYSKRWDHGEKVFEITDAAKNFCRCTEECAIIPFTTFQSFGKVTHGHTITNRRLFVE